MTPSRAAFAAYGAVGLIDLLALGLDAGTVHTVAKALLLPLLALAALRGGPPPRPLTAALFFGWVGDVLLMFGNDALFLAGMGAFAAGHVSYLVLFLKYGRRNGRSDGMVLPDRTALPDGVATALPDGMARARVPRPAVVLGTLAAMVVVLALLWSGLPGPMRIPVVLYSALLTAMGLNSARLGTVAALGGALFMVSDTLLATGLAGRPDVPGLDVWVMLTYVAAQFLLVTGTLRTLGGAGDTSEALPDGGRLRSA